MFFVAGGALLFVAQLLVPVAAGQNVSSTFSCQPGAPCWPSLAEWQAFNETVSGRLKVTTMLSSPCFPSSPDFDNAACATIKANWANATFRQLSYGAQEITQWEACGDANCYPGLVPPQASTCSLGRLSALYVDAETPSDITATLKFVKRHRIRLVVKNTGHDYLGRSAAANTLALRTYNMKQMSFHSNFTAHNCFASNKQNIGIIGAGVTAGVAINFFEQYGMMVTTGGCPSVGIAGGFGQGGGHGPLSPTHGLMVDQAIEFDVVTTDGVFRTINQCNEPDLFWAMRGGGGQSYAILVNYKFQLHAQIPWATWRLEASLTPDSSNVTQNTVLRDVLVALANNQTTWSKNHISGYDVVSPTEVTFLEILPAAGDPLSTIKELTASFNTFLSNHPAINVTINSYSLYPHESGFYTGQADYLSRSGSVGASILNPSRLITSDNFGSPSKVDALVNGILQGMETVIEQLGAAMAPHVPFLLLKTAPFNTPDTTHAASANPAWRNTLWHLIAAAVWAPGTPDEITDQIAAAARAALDDIKKPLAIQAAYLNEADAYEPDWEHVFFGDNYDRLLQIKKKWDPETVLNCKKCVGYLGPQDPMYSCYGDNPKPSVPYPFV